VPIAACASRTNQRQLAEFAFWINAQ